MKHSGRARISVVVPIHNEGLGLPDFHAQLMAVMEKAARGAYEILYCDDGSTDDSAASVAAWHAGDPRVKLIKLSRNFGKEAALSAGIAQAAGEAIITLDGDGQHPIALIPAFIAAWQAGAQVVVGVRTNASGGLLKEAGSKLFYGFFNRLTAQKLIPGSTDFRLIDRAVQAEFLTLKESNRITRGLIDWLGFQRAYVRFEALPRANGTPAYSLRRLFRLATNSLVSLTPQPLYLFGYLGVVITGLAFVLGTAVIIEQLLLDDPWHWKFTGTAMLGILLVFLVGIVLLSQAILSLYISHIQTQSQQRPLYIIDYKNSAGIRRSGDA